MSETIVQCLPSETAHLISSSQIITSVSSVVKELMENSLDSGAANITIKLENFGNSLIEVKDDGHGISSENVKKMFLPGYTSKIQRFEDLDCLTTYGFRGEALSAICRVGETSLITKTDSDTFATSYTINFDGTLANSTLSHHPKGSVISVKNIFHALPVRKQYISSKKRMAEELKRVESVVQSLSVVHPALRVVLSHNKCPIWQKNAVTNLKQSFMQVVGLRIAAKMDLIEEDIDNVRIDLIIPKKGGNNKDGLIFSSTCNAYIHINLRPVVYKEIAKEINDHICHHYQETDVSKKHAMFLLSLTVPTQEIDVNLEPNKTRVLLKNLPEVVSAITTILNRYYNHCLQGGAEKKNDADSMTPAKKLKLDETLDTSQNMESLPTPEPRVWSLKVTDHDNTNDGKNVFGVCSQINKNNCILTSEKEVSVLNELLESNKTKLITSVQNKTSLDNREDIQRPTIQNTFHDTTKRTTPNTNKVQLSIKEFTPPIKISTDVSEYEASTIYDKSIDDSSAKKVQSTIENFVLPTEKQDVGKQWSAAQWSRGQVILDDGRTLQGGAALAVSEDFDLSLRSVSSQMGQKELSGFTKFARIMRPKIIDENPNIKFTEVATILAERWRELLPDEMEFYNSVAEAVVAKRKIHSEKKSEIVEDRKNKKKPTMDKKKIWPEEKTSISISLDLIRKLRKRSEPIDDIAVIGQIKPNNNWLYRFKGEIGHLRHIGLQESVLYYRLLENHFVNTVSLDPVVFISESLLGISAWQALISLPTEYDVSCDRYIVSSRVIVSNGLRLEMIATSDGIGSGHITKVPCDVDVTPLDMLKEILDLYQTNGKFDDLKLMRPAVIKNVIAMLVKKMVRESTDPLLRDYLQEFLRTWHERGYTNRCLHDREILVPIYTISDVQDDMLTSRLL